MKASRLFIPAALTLIILLLLLGVTPFPAAGQAAAVPVVPASQADPGNYCVSCHTPGDPRLAAAAAWTGTIERETISPCPALTAIHQELYYTERQLLMIERVEQRLPQTDLLDKILLRVDGTTQSYERLLDAPVNSLEAFTNQALQTRYTLGKNYDQLNQLVEGVKQRNVLLVALALSLVVLGSLAWGFYNTQKALGKSGAQPVGTAQVPWWRKLIPRAVVVLLIFLLFALPIFRDFPQAVERATAQELAQQNTLDTARRSAQTADQALARAWMIGRVGAAWSASDPQQANLALDQSLSAADEARANSEALWGQAQAAHEINAGSGVKEEKALLVAEALLSVRDRTWDLRLTAGEWATVDPQQAEELLKQAAHLAAREAPPYRDLDLRGIAVTWAALNLDKALETAGQVKDPALRAWALREIAAQAGASYGTARAASLYQGAATAAREVSDPLQKAYALSQVALANGDHNLFSEGLAALKEVTGSDRAYALSDLAAASGDPSLVEQIDAIYPAARAAALLRLKQYSQAWKAAAEIADPYNKARAQAEIAGAWANPEAAQEIAVPALRSRAMRLVAIAKNDPVLASLIPDAYQRVQALTALGLYDQAFEQADDLSDTYPLIVLARDWAPSNLLQALVVVDKMDQEIDKAAALRAILAVTCRSDLKSCPAQGAATISAELEEETFQRALGMAMAARQSGDVLSPAEASLALAQLFPPGDPRARQAFSQALEIAQKITIK